MKTKLLFYYFLLLRMPIFAQFSGGVGAADCAAIQQDSNVIRAWAVSCTVVRGYQNVADTALGRVSYGNDTMGIGKAGTNGVVSLGDGGSAILTFKKPIRNSVGADFVVFENAFNDTFLELAFVEVSSNGIDFYRFRATSNTQTSVQIGTFDNIGNATQLNNLAGKYRGRYGTPFDLEELKDKPNLNVNAVTHVKIIDVVGSINSLYAMYDQNNNPVNDPFPTPFPSGGFDLDAVGVLYENNLFSNSNEQLVFPNPVQSNGLLKIQTNTVIQNVAFYQINGVLVFEHRQNLPILNLDISLLGYSKGVYVLYVQTELGYFTKKIIIL